MKFKETLTENQFPKDATPKAKPQSLRPMRSLVAVRSLKPKTAVANMVLAKSEETAKRA
jgi:hypothetical protein